jgi:hypothetical protein
MQSHISSKTTKKKAEERPSLPWGLGSARFKGRTWWIVYRTAKDEVREENAGTDDIGVARRILAQRALPRARAAVELLESIANAETDQGNGEAGGTTSRLGRGSGKTPADTRAGAGTKKGGRK